jgi:hypothetical protein
MRAVSCTLFQLRTGSNRLRVSNDERGRPPMAAPLSPLMILFFPQRSGYPVRKATSKRVRITYVEVVHRS